MRQQVPVMSAPPHVGGWGVVVGAPQLGRLLFPAVRGGWTSAVVDAFFFCIVVSSEEPCAGEVARGGGVDNRCLLGRTVR